MPGFAGDEGVDVRGESHGIAHGAEGVVGKGGQCFAGEGECVQPGAEAMAGEGGEKSFFRAGIVSEHDAAREHVAQIAPKLVEVRCLAEHGGGDAMNPGGAPAHGAVAGDVGGKDVFLAEKGFNSHDADLDRVIRLAGGSPGGFEVDGGNGELRQRAIHQLRTHSRAC